MIHHSSFIIHPLTPELRNKLERTIINARDVAEAGAKAALEALAVHHYEPYTHMSPGERKLRNHLRARARQLGDKQNRKGELEISHLIRECAYEHWHCMLFARFLAENDLLIEPETGVAISLEECEGLAREEGKELWTLASEFAQRMLPQIFRPDDPILKVTFAREHRLKLERSLNDLEPAVFTASDSLGWVYQFWQSKQKKEVNESENKIGADELPAVTQLFTEPYMVHFLIHNTLGAWWAGKKVEAASSRFHNVSTEEEMRRAVSIPGCSWNYLRFVKVDKVDKVDAASCRINNKRQDAASTLGYFHKDEPIANLSGNLPHWRQQSVTYFVTFRTADSLPQEKLNQWKEEKSRWLADHPEPHDEATRKEFYERFPQRFQEWLDKGYGACLLGKTEYKNIVENALRHFDGVKYSLDKFAVAPNHVHALVTPLGEHELSGILHSWKSFTANEMNKITGNKGAFWQKESFDHIVRSSQQVERIREYIMNHVKVNVEVEEASSLLNKNKVEAASSRLINKSQDGSSTFSTSTNKRQDAASTINASTVNTVWQPAAGTFEGWPKNASELKILDPCCGSGHFLVAVFQHLVPLRMAAEGLSAREACDVVLRDNLFGLEIDERCTQIAAFAMAMAAWRYPGAGSFRNLPMLNIACSGLSISVAKEEWKKLAKDKHNLHIALDWLHDQFQEAPVIGSLIDPAGSDAAKLVEWTELSQMLDHALIGEQDDERTEMGVVAHGLAKAARLLAGKYHWVITNVPYLSRGKQGETLKEFCETHCPAAKNDIATVFLDRCLAFCTVEEASSLLNKSQDGSSTSTNKRQDAASTVASTSTGTVSVVLPQNWLFLTTYRKFREKLLRNDTWHFIARLGPGAFETITGEVVKAILLILSRGQSRSGFQPLFDKDLKGQEPGRPFYIRCIDVSTPRTAKEKVKLLLMADIQEVEQKKQLENPDAAMICQNLSGQILLSSYATINYGSKPGQTERVTKCFWELPLINNKEWQFLESTPSGESIFSGKEKVCLSLKEIKLQKINEFGIRSADIWGTSGIVISQMKKMPYSLYFGYIFDNNTSVISPMKLAYLPAIFSFLESGEYLEEVRRINQKLDVAAHTMVKVPFDLEYWQKVAAEKYPDGLPKPYSNDPTQWIFHGHPAKVEAASSLLNKSQDGSSTLQVAMARLMGYRWPAELESRSGFQPLDKDKQNKSLEGSSTMELSDEARALVKKCDALLKFADEDGIVCISSVRGEEPAADRLSELLACAFGQVDAASSLLNKSQDGSSTSTKKRQDAASTLDDWLRDHFFEQHCKLFHHRPFIWHIWDGRRRDGFHALVNYHKLSEGNGKGRQLLENLTYSYLGDWITRQKEGVKRGEGGAEDRLAAAVELQKLLIAILEGERPFDIFIRWKPIEEQPIGWEPDINNGVRINIRPFMAHDIPGGRKGAGILRWRPNIKWNKDRGKEPNRSKDEYPWFYEGDEFIGNRVNDIHLTIEEKVTKRQDAASTFKKVDAASSRVTSTFKQEGKDERE